jgi:hypothetical protein
MILFTVLNFFILHNLLILLLIFMLLSFLILLIVFILLAKLVSLILIYHAHLPKSYPTHLGHLTLTRDLIVGYIKHQGLWFGMV